MTGRQYRLLERVVEGFLVTLLGSLIAALLLGIYALASLVF